MSSAGRPAWSGSLRSLLNMLELEANPFLGAFTKLRQIIVLSERLQDKTQPMLEDGRRVLSDHLDSLILEIQKIGSRSALASAGRLRSRIADPNDSITYSDIYGGLLDIESRFADHLNDIKLFVLNEGEASLFQPADALLSVPDRPVEGFSMAYPNAAFEIEEASKCIALGRHTASAFHSMRALECGIRAVCALLEIPDATKPSEKNWGVILKAVKSAIDEKWPKDTRLPGTAGSSLESLYATLDAVKNPWRNATMHVETIYAPHEATHILRCVAVFMLSLAAICDEEGRVAEEAPAMTAIEGSSAT
jgi:hypothetical protein